MPKIAPGCDLRKLPIGAREGFVLSRVDGASTLGDIATLTGFPVDEVERIFTRLVELKATYFGDRAPTVAPPPPPPPAAEPKKEPPKVRRRARPRRWDPSALDEPSDLDHELKTQILDLFHSLEDVDHYELLGVAREADRKAIKSAYYALAARFHTDRYFGKNLGGFRSKMEQIFGRVTQAHDTLANKARRAEYDAYIADRERTRAFERYLAGEDDVEEEVEEPAPAASSVPPAPPSVSGSMPSISAAAPISSLPPESIAPVSVTSSSAPPVNDPDRLRREALARRLMGSGRFRAAPALAPQKTAPPPPTTIAPANPQAATEALRRRYEENVEHAKKSQIRKLLDAAEDAVRKGDLLAAANHYRLALRYTDDPVVQEAYEDANRRARDFMAETYLKQAKYEEQASKWGAAALSYLKAHEGRPDDADLCERTANALRMEGRDLHKAARFGELAVQKNPTHAPFRVTLGAVYLDAGLFLRARSELEQAAKLDPSNAQIKELLARARKMAS